MSTKCPLAIVQMGMTLRKEYPDLSWEELIESIGSEELQEKYRFHEGDMECLQAGFENRPPPAALGHHERIMIGKYKGALMHEVPAEYYEWFWRQEWKREYPQIIHWIRSHKCILKKKRLDKEQDTSDVIKEIQTMKAAL